MSTVATSPKLLLPSRLKYGRIATARLPSPPPLIPGDQVAIIRGLRTHLSECIVTNSFRSCKRTEELFDQISERLAPRSDHVSATSAPRQGRRRGMHGCAGTVQENCHRFPAIFYRNSSVLYRPRTVTFCEPFVTLCYRLCTIVHYCSLLLPKRPVA